MDNLKKLIDIVFDKEFKNSGLSVAYFSNSKDYPTFDTLLDIYSNIQNDSKKKSEFVSYLIDSIRKMKQLPITIMLE